MRLLWLFLLALLAACGADQGLPAEPLRLPAGSLPPAYLGEPYRAELFAAGGLRPYSYELRGKLPEGLVFKGGVISGTPRAKGKARFEVTVKDAALSAVTKSFVLVVGDPPPPAFDFVLPPVAVADPFVAVVRLSGRRTLGFEARFVLRDLKPDLKTLRVTKGALYLARFDEETNVLGLDLAYFQPAASGEVFRLTLVPEKKALFKKIPYEARFLDAKGKPFAASERVAFAPSKTGKYAFTDLVRLARNWGKRAEKGKALEGDLNRDGRVDEADLALLRADYRWAWPEKKPKPLQSQGSPRKSSSIPEASSSLP